MTRPYIMVAPNGARKGKADHAALPVTISEILVTARCCRDAGADALHLHVRDAQGNHSLDAGIYREALTELADQLPDLRVQITTEAAGRFDVPEQFKCLSDLQPKWASVSVREIARKPEMAAKVYGLCAEQGTEVQHILYDEADIRQLLSWRARDIVRPTQDSVLFVLGRYSQGQTSSPDDLVPFRKALPGIGNWMVCAFGPHEHACLVSAAKQGGSLRVGFENSLLTADGQIHRNNAASVAALVETLKAGV